MPRKTSARVVYNRQVADQLRLGVADGLLALGEAIIEAADPPDAEPFGVGLVTSGGVVVYIDGRKVGGTASKPRAARLENPGIVLFAGWGFPGRFQEFGTVHHPAQPFGTPALERVVPDADQYVGAALRARLGGR